MQLRTLVPTLALSATAVGGLQASDVQIGGFVDAILNIVDEEAADDTSIDFTSTAVLQLSSEISEVVSLNVDLQYDDMDSFSLRQAYSTWAVNDQVTLQFGKSISWIGYQAAYAPGLYRVGVTPYTGDYYGNDTVGVWGMFSPMENVGVTVAIVDDIYGSKSEPDSFGIGAEASVDIEGYGNVQVELQYDQSGADFWQGYTTEAIAADDAAMTILAHTTADQVVDGFTFGGEIVYGDYDASTGMGIMAMANYVINDMASATLMVSYYDPNTDDDVGGTDDDLIEVAVALLTTPTMDSNFAVNAEIAFLSSEASDDIGIFLEALAIIP